MARGLNKCILIGNLGNDPEIKYAASGTAIANLSLATTESRKNREGSWEDITEWHRIVMFGKQAEVCKDYLRKGSKVYIEGRMQTRSWDDKNGEKKYTTEIVGNSMIMLDSKGDNTPHGQQSQQRSSFNSNQAPPSQQHDTPDDDLPF